MVARIPQAPKDNDAVDGPALLWRKGWGIDHRDFDAAHTSRSTMSLHGAPRSADTENVESHQPGRARPFLGQFRGLEYCVQDSVVSVRRQPERYIAHVAGLDSRIDSHHPLSAHVWPGSPLAHLVQPYGHLPCRPKNRRPRYAVRCETVIPVGPPASPTLAHDATPRGSPRNDALAGLINAEFFVGGHKLGEIAVEFADEAVVVRAEDTS